MGILSKWATREPDPLMSKLVDTLSEQIQQQQKFTTEVVQMLGSQQELMQKFMNQYIGSGQNAKSTLDDRLYSAESRVEAPEWEPIPNPFDGM